MESGISVIICSFNGEDRLPETMAHLAGQMVSDDIRWEIIVVDSASTDKTADVANEFWSSRGIKRVPLRVMHEPVRGLMRARKKGIGEARYDLIVFCDDDNHFHPGYLAGAHAVMREKPEVGILGGYAKPKFQTHPGKWIEDLYSALAIGRQAPADGYVNWVYGAGMVMRQELFEKFRLKGIEFILAGREGGRQTSGDDVEICLLARSLGYSIYYTDRLELDHAVSSHRLTRKFFVEANSKNVFPLVVLFIMERLVINKNALVKNLYNEKLKAAASSVFYFLPRSVVGRHRFYSFIMLYQNAQLTWWMLFRSAMFAEAFQRVKRNIG